MNLVIDRNIPLPNDQRGNGRPKSQARKTVEAMRIGDSVKVVSKADAANVRGMIRKSGFKAAQRQDSDGIRLWRVA